MFTFIASGRTAGARVKEEIKESGDKVTQLTFSLYTKVKKGDKYISQWITCTMRGKGAETIAPWLMVERKEKQDDETKDKYVSRLVNVVGRLNIERKVVDVPYQILDDDEELLFEGTTEHNDTGVVVYIDNIEFLDASPEKSKELDNTTKAELTDKEKEKLKKLQAMKDKANKAKEAKENKDTKEDKDSKKDK